MPFPEHVRLKIRGSSAGPRGVIQQWHFFLLVPFYNLHRFIKHDNILRIMNINSHLNETNVVISLRVSITNHLKLVRIYLRNPVYRPYQTQYETDDGYARLEGNR